jgi:hypothetical protein
MQWKGDAHLWGKPNNIKISFLTSFLDHLNGRTRSKKVGSQNVLIKQRMEQ